MRYRYDCPGCGTSNSRHQFRCDFARTSNTEIEKAHIDIISRLSLGPCEKETLRDDIYGEWSELHRRILHELIQDQRVSLTQDLKLTLIKPSNGFDGLEPQQEPLKTIYQTGSYPGAHDNSIFALIAYFESLDLTWEQTKKQVIDWLHNSGAWERGGFKESTPEKVLDKKRHVYERDYGWRNKAKAAKRVIKQKHSNQTQNKAVGD